ncbi:VanZ family protein [Streptomyces sp. NBC_01506]
MVVLVVALLLLVGFAVVLAQLTLTPSPASSEIAGANLRPGRSLRQYAEDYTFLAACKQVGGNVLMGAPFGLLLPVLVPRRHRMLRVMVLTVVTMTVVELAQGAIVEGRAFDVDDVIMNTSGAFVAYLLLGRRLSHRFHTLGFRSLEGQARRAEERERERRRARAAKRAEAAARKKASAGQDGKTGAKKAATAKKTPAKKTPAKKAATAKKAAAPKGAARRGRT